MRKKYFNLIKIIAVFTFITTLLPNVLFAESDGFEVELNVIGCNNNTVCESSIGEDVNTCPNDCIIVPDPGPSESDNSSYGSRKKLNINNVNFFLEENGSTISWTTNYPTLNKFFWGTTVNYELGVLSETSYTKEHSVKISNLSPSNRYFFSIVSVDKYGNQIFFNDSFISMRTPHYLFPENVKDIKVERKKGSNLFTWINPNIVNFSGVRIIRLENFFSRDPFDGLVLYEGGGNSFRDSNFDENKNYYYSFFVRDLAGNYSSGAFLPVLIEDLVEENKTLESNIGLEFEKKIINGLNLNIFNFNFKQNNIGISFNSEDIPIVADAPIEVSVSSNFIPRDSLIVISVKSRIGEIKERNILMRRNNEGTYYIGEIPKMISGENHAFTIKVFDRNYQLKSLTEGKFIMSVQEKNPEKNNIFIGLMVMFLLVFIAMKIKKIFT